MTWLGVCLHRSHRCGGICRLSYSPQRNCTQSGHLQATCTCRTKKPRGHLPIFVLWGLNGQRSEPCDVLSQVLHEETAFALPVKNRVYKSMSRHHQRRFPAAVVFTGYWVVMRPPIHTIILFTGVDNEQLVCYHRRHHLRVLLHYGCHIDAKCLQWWTAPYAYIGLTTWDSMKWWGSTSGVAASCALLCGSSSARSMYSHLYIRSSSFLGIVAIGQSQLTVFTCCCDMPCRKAANWVAKVFPPPDADTTDNDSMVGATPSLWYHCCSHSTKPWNVWQQLVSCCPQTQQSTLLILVAQVGSHKP